MKQDAERELAEAKPALDAALSALNSITPKDINALKALKNPPDVIKRIFDCVLLLRWGPLGADEHDSLARAGQAWLCGASSAPVGPTGSVWPGSRTAACGRLAPPAPACACHAAALPPSPAGACP